MGNSSSMCCGGKSKKRKTLENEIDDRYCLLGELKTQSTLLQSKFSEQDSQLVGAKIRTTEEGLTDLRHKVSKHQTSYGSLGSNLEDIKEEAKKYLTSLEEVEAQNEQITLLGHQPSDVEPVISDTKIILENLSAKQKILDGIVEKAHSLIAELPSQEKGSVEQLVATVQSKHSAVHTLISEKCEALEMSMAEREDLQKLVNTESVWLSEREATNQKMSSIRLLASDIKKQSEKYKKFASKVKSHNSHINNVEQKGEDVKKDCHEEAIASIDSIVGDIKTRYNELLGTLEKHKLVLRDNQQTHKQFEENCAKIEKWCKNTEQSYNQQLPVDCAIELVEEQHKQYKALNDTALLMESLVKETVEIGDGFKSTLLETDLPLLEEQLDTIQSTFKRVSSNIGDRIQRLEQIMEDRYLLEKKIEECSVHISAIHEELRLLSKTCPTSTEHAKQTQVQYQNLEEKLVLHKPSLVELNGRLEELRTSGQIHNVEAILLLNKQYEQLIDQISHLKTECEQAVVTRQQFEEQTLVLETSLVDYENEIRTINETELSASERLQRYKQVLEKLVNLQPDVTVALDKAQQLALDQPSSETPYPLDKVKTIEIQMETLRKSVEEKSLEYKSLLKERDSFNVEMDKTLAWLGDKDDFLASCGSLDLDPVKVSHMQKKHEKISREAKDKIDNMKVLIEKEKLHYENLQEPMPNEAEAKLKQMEDLQNTILSAITVKEQYLSEAQSDREQYKNSMRQVTDWIHGAQALLDSGYEGLDYDSIDQTLSEYTDHFSEASLCQDEVEQITELSDRLIPTLDVNDKETLQQSIQHVTQKLSSITSVSQDRQQLLEEKSTEWKDYLIAVDEMNETIEGLEVDWSYIDQSSVSDPQRIEMQLESIKEFLERIEEKRPAVGELNERSHSLERAGNDTSRTIITRLITAVNTRWHSLVTQAENKQTNIKEICAQWKGFSGTVSSVGDILREAELKLSTVNTDLIKYQELVVQVETLKDVSAMLKDLEPQMDIMKKSSQDLQKTLPSAEAKVLSQDSSISLLEKYERIWSKSKEELETIQEELDDRNAFRSDIDQLIGDLQSIKANVLKLSPNTDTSEILKQIKVFEQDILTAVGEAKKLEKVQESKYRAQGRELPEDMLLHLSSLREVEADVTHCLKNTGESLLHLQEDRQIFTESLKNFNSWIQETETELQKPIINITESMSSHNDLLKSIDKVKEDLDHLRRKGGDIVLHSSDTGEKQSVQKNLADVNRKWNSVQAKLAEKTKKLNEALILHTTFTEATVEAIQWTDEATLQIGREQTWSNFDDVSAELKSTKKVAKEILQNQEKLKSLKPVVKQLNQLTDIETVNTTMATLSQRLDNLNSNTKNKMAKLHDVNKSIESYEKEMEDVSRWLDHARTILSSHDMHVSQDMKEELTLSEKLLSDARINKEKAQEILGKHKEIAVDLFPEHGSKILAEISQLEGEVSDRVEQLTTAVQEEEQYQTELSSLNDAVNDAQQKLLASPVMASSVEALKQQIAERDTLAAQIKSYQERINSLNEKSRQLFERSRHHYPMFMRHRFFPDSSGHSSLISSYNSKGHFDSGIDSTDLTSSRYSDASVQPDSSWSNVLSKSTNTVEAFKIQGNDNESTQSLPGTTSANLSMDSFSTTQSIVPRLELGSDLDVTSSHEFLSERLPKSKQTYLYRTCSGGNITTKPLGKSKVTFGEESSSSHSRTTKNISSLIPSSRSTSIDNNLNLSYHFPQQEGKSRSLVNISSPKDCSTPVAMDKENGTITKRVSGMRHKLWCSTGRIPEGPELPPPPNKSQSVSDLAGADDTTKDNQLRELNKSWNSLQQQANAKERELLAALEQQEAYQKSVQDITRKMEKIHAAYFTNPINYLENLDDQMKEHKILLSDIEKIDDDIKKVREYGAIIEASDPEGYKTVKSTLNMLTDKLENLQHTSHDREIALNNAIAAEAQHKVELESYKNNISDLENWLSASKVDHAESGLETDSLQELQLQLDRNKVLQNDINSKLHTISDLAVHCDRLCQMQPPISAEKMRNQLAYLQNQLSDYKLTTIEKQSTLRQTIKEAEKRERELVDYDRNVKQLQQWMAESKQMTLPPSDIAQVNPQETQLQKALLSGLSEHRMLLSDISASGKKIKEHGEKKDVTDSTTMETLQSTWETLQKDLALKKQNLEDSIQTTQMAVRRTSIQYQPWTYSQDTVTGDQLEHIHQMMEDLNTSWRQLQTQVDDKQLRLDQAISFQQLYQNALLSISAWLDDAEQRLFSADLTKSTEEQITENENLQSEIQKLQSEISFMNQQAQDLFSHTNVQNGKLMKQSLDNLNSRVAMLETHARDQGTELHQINNKWKRYQTEVVSCRRKLEDTKSLVSVPPTSVEDLTNQIQKVESDLKDCENQLEDLKYQERVLSTNFPHGVFPSELNSLQQSYMDVQRKLTSRKSELQQSASLREQYEGLLVDYAEFLETAQSKLKTDSLSAQDLNHLKQQLAAHKDFFGDLENHKAMLDVLAEQCDGAIRDKHKGEHVRLTQLTTVLVDEASLHGQRLERLTKQWEELQHKYITLQSNLKQIENNIPKTVASGDSLKTIEGKVSKFRQLQKDLSSQKTTVFQVVEKGKHILHSVTCPSLETTIGDLADKWVDLNALLSQDLKRTEILGDRLQRFEAEASILASWLATANTKVVTLKKLSKKEKKTIAGVRGKVEKLLEFQKEVENQVTLKNKVIAVGQQLLHDKTYDTTGLKDRLLKFEQDWEKLQQDIQEAEKFLHKEQMARMPSRQALQELEDWLEEIKRSLKDDPDKLIKTVKDVESMLKKYTNYKVELASKQISIDFVNQSILQPQEEEEETEKVAFAEKLGELNTQWQVVSADVNKRLDFLEHLKCQWERFEHAGTSLKDWFKEQNNKIEYYLQAGHEVGVQETLRECKTMKQGLIFKEAEITKFKEMGDRLMELCHNSKGCQHSIQQEIDSINKSLVALEEKLRCLENSVEDMTGKWSRYKSQLQDLNTVLTQTEYCLNSYHLIGGDISTLRGQLEKLKICESELKHNQRQLKAFQSLSKQLSEGCDAQIKLELQKTVSDIQQRWKDLLTETQKRVKVFEEKLSQWQKYEEKYGQIRSWLDEKERDCNHLKTQHDTNTPVALERCKNLHIELDEIQIRLAELYQFSDTVTRNMDQSTISILSSRQTLLEQRLVRLRQQLTHHMETLQDDSSQFTNFNEAYEIVKAFLSHAESVLAASDPSKSSDESDLQERLECLKDLQSMFNNNMLNLDIVNDLGYRLALKPIDANRMQELNHKWYRLLSETSVRCKYLQGNVVVQQDFTAKCDSWMSFLSQTEQDMSVDVASNLADLLHQQRKYEKFTADKYSREEVLRAILSDGHQLLRSGDVRDVEEFKQNLHLLADQWQHVVRQATQKKAIIDSNIDQWHLFNKLSDSLCSWLKDKDQEVHSINVHNPSLQQIQNFLEKINLTKEHFKFREDDFKKIHDLGNILLQFADLTASKEIKVCLAQLEHSWYQVYSQLEEHRIQLEEQLSQWRECDDDIDDILAWLKETRNILNTDIPQTYDDIQQDINRCKDIEAAFIRSEDRRQRLLIREASLASLIQSEDMNILHQRIRLLNKQWQELGRQVTLRLRRLQDTTCRWSNFSERVRVLIKWIDDMEERVIGGTDIQVEDLILTLETEIKEEMSEKEKVKDELLAEGKALIKVSSDVRSSDIESRSEKLENKWQHLTHVVSFRQRKLNETVLAVKQLDNSMKNLGKWLTDIEQELNVPVIYQTCDISEIQRHLECQQDLQRDIERHSAGVASVLNLCQVLLHDTDACPTEVEFNSLQTTMESLDRRWKNICLQSPKRRTRIDETWKMWEKFRQDTDAFIDWLEMTEREVRRREVNPISLSSKDEVNQFENLQKNIRSQITQLENINKQYRAMAKAGQVDSKGFLKSVVQEVNDRWDKLQERTSATVKGMRKTVDIRDEYSNLRTLLINWLQEMEVQITNIEYLSESDSMVKLEEIDRLESEIERRGSDCTRLEELAALLRIHGEESQAAMVEGEMQDYQNIYKQMIERLNMFKQRLERTEYKEIDTLTRTLDETQQTVELSGGITEYTTTQSYTREMISTKESIYEREMRETEEYLKLSPPESPIKHKSGGRRTPRSARSPSRWAQHADTIDGGDAKWRQMRTDMLRRRRSSKVENLLESLADSIEDADNKLSAAENELQTSQALGHVDRTERFIYYMDACGVAVENIKTLDRLIKKESGLNTIASADSHIRNITERWERLQSGNVPTQVTQRPDHIQFLHDLDNMLLWLDEADALQSTLSPLPHDMEQLDLVIRQFKDFLVQLESRKTRVLSINLISRGYVDPKTQEGRELRDKLHEMNGRWENLCARINEIQQDLQTALTDSEEFHHTIHDMMLWLERLERQLQECEPINIQATEAVLWGKYNKLKDIHGELEKKQDKAVTLRETADQLLLNSDSTQMVNAKDKTHIIANRLRALLRLCNSYISSLESRLDLSTRTNASIDETDLTSGLGSSRGSRSTSPYYQTPPPGTLVRSRNRSPFAISRQLVFGETRPLLQARVEESPKLGIACVDDEEDIYATPFCSRVLRAALPIQLLMLLLLGLACLVPVCEDDYSCDLVNNLHRSLHLVLRYVNGPPPS